MAITALGPTIAGGMQPIVKDGYELTFFPDVNNAALQQSNQAPVFYYLPKTLRMARRDGSENGPFAFNLIKFAGVEKVGDANEQVAGGILTFSVTAQVPDRILQESQQKIIDQYNASADHFWGIRTRIPPVFRPAIITSNLTSITNLSPLANRTVPSVMQLTRTSGRNGHAPEIRAMPVPTLAQLPRTVPLGAVGTRSGALDAWYWNVQGQGNGSIDPTGTQAYSALVGAYPANILWEGFHGEYSPINVWMNVKVKFWAPTIEIRIDGHWDRVFEHFSAAASGRYLWFSADLKAEFNKMRTNGTITSEILVDPTIPGGETIVQNLEKRSDLIFEKFMAAAQKMIFEQPQPQVEAAQASSSSGVSLFSPYGLGVGLKYRRDTTQLELHYHEKRQMAYLQDDVISGTMEGMFQEMKNDPEAGRRYFLSVYFDDWPRTIGRMVKPVVNWPQPENNWVGQPVAFVSAQIGYPNTRGEIMWQGKTFQKSDPPDANWNFGITQKTMSDVSNPPAGWSPDQTFVKRKIHLLEAPDVAENPFVRVQIDENVISLDPEPNGTLTNDINIEVRADAAGKLMVGPLSLNVDLENEKQTVEITFEPTDERGNPTGREPVKFVWLYGDQAQPRFWSIFSGDPNFRSFYRYKVRVVVKGSLFTQGMEWEGPWELASANGPLMVRVPTPEAEGVVTRDLPFGELLNRLPAAAGGAPPAVRSEPPAMESRGKRPLSVGGYRLGSAARSAPPPATAPAAASGVPATAAPPASSGTSPAPSGHEEEAFALRPSKVATERTASTSPYRSAPLYFEETGTDEEMNEEMYYTDQPAGRPTEQPATPPPARREAVKVKKYG